MISEYNVFTCTFPIVFVGDNTHIINIDLVMYSPIIINFINDYFVFMNR